MRLTDEGDLDCPAPERGSSDSAAVKVQQAVHVERANQEQVRQECHSDRFYPVQESCKATAVTVGTRELSHLNSLN